MPVMDLDEPLHSTPIERKNSSERRKQKGSKPNIQKDDDNQSLSYSFDSETGDSTRSLLSVLSHSSIGELSKSKASKSSLESGTDFQSESAASKLRSSRCSSSRRFSTSTSQTKSSSRSNSGNSRSSHDTQKRNSTHTPTQTATSESTKPDQSLSPWEQWLVRKVEEERKQVCQEVKKEKEVRRKEEEKRREKSEKAKMIEVKINNWIEEKNTKEAQDRCTQMHLKRVQAQIDAEEQQRVLDRAQANRKGWLEQKKEQKHLKREKELAESERKAAEEIERKKTVQDAYDKWKGEAKKKSKSVLHGYAYSQGMLKGYYNTTTNPAPSFYNPIPWAPILVPKSDTVDDHNISSHKTKLKKVKTKLVQQQVPSPPLLFKSRTSPESVIAWDRPR